jgi:hypothetical protein
MEQSEEVEFLEPHEQPRPARPRSAVISAVIAVLFGLLTIKSGGTVLFVDGPARVAAGNYTPFVLWFNFLSGFAYIVAGVGIYLWRGWAVTLALVIALASVLVFVAFGITIFAGSNFESRTVGAMTLRSVLWLVISLNAHRIWKSQQ